MAPQADQSVVIEEDLNSVLHEEMATIQRSLARINDLTKSTTKHTVKHEVTDSIAQSIGLWNDMMAGLGEKTDLDVEKLSSSSASMSFR